MEKSNIAGWGKKSKSLKWPQKFFNYVLQWYLTGDKKNCIYFWKLDINTKIKEQNEKNKIAKTKKTTTTATTTKKNGMNLSISKNFATIFDQGLDLNEAHN